VVLAVLLASLSGWAQNQCPYAVRIEGMVTDPAGAVIPGAQVKSVDGEKRTTDAKGIQSFMIAFGCFSVGLFFYVFYRAQSS
jgi:hypothetical protein